MKAFIHRSTVLLAMGIATATCAQFQHSTFSDTVGLGAELRIIESKLGRLSADLRNNLVPVEVQYYSFVDKACTKVDPEHLYSGILIVHRCIADDVKAIFEAMKRDRFPIAKVVPVNCYGLNADSTGWDDDASMADNNTSAFNYRSRPTSPKISKHAMGIAIDINPMLNPCLIPGPNGPVLEPPLGNYDPKRRGTLDKDKAMRYSGRYGWSWGGLWPRPKDRQHIEKTKGKCAHMVYSNVLQK